MKDVLARQIVINVEPSSSEREAAMVREIGQISAILDTYVANWDGSALNQNLTSASLRSLPSILVQTRVARGMSQADLAALVGITQTQICRYESTHYAHVPLPRVIEIYDALTS